VKRTIISLVILTNIIVGCSNEQVYTAVQSNRRLECQKLPQGQYEECMKQYDQPYGAYAKDRDEVLKDKQ
jgi:uncharacterized lipoprotein NlpE involved in copper resistance